MLIARRAVNIEFLFKEVVYGGVEREWESGRPANAYAPVEVKAPRALHEEVDLRARQLEGFARSRFVRSLGSFGGVIDRHLVECN